MNEPNTLAELHSQFIALLKKIYGSFNKEMNKFESTSNSKIARDLFYSDSQFSRLINGTASEGEFKRAIRNVQRSLELKKLKTLPQNTQTPQSTRVKNAMLFTTLLFFICITLYLGYQTQFNSTEKEPMVAEEPTRFDMLQWSFENKYINPYVKLRDLPDDCYYPCYKYQGKWTLKKEYKIPFFRERNGFHYVAKEATMYSNCLQSDRNVEGETFEGYEYQRHEIWYDLREMPIDSFLVSAGSTGVKASYNDARLEDDENFVKIAYLHTFFRGEFNIDSTSVHRTGKVIGRDIEFVADRELLAALGSEALVREVHDEVNAIAQNRLEDFSKPINCDPARVPREDFHMLKEGDEMEFSCQFSTGRFLVDYTKTYQLEYQYINSVCR